MRAEAGFLDIVLPHGAGANSRLSTVQADCADIVMLHRNAPLMLQRVTGVPVMVVAPTENAPVVALLKLIAPCRVIELLGEVGVEVLLVVNEISRPA